MVKYNQDIQRLDPWQKEVLAHQGNMAIRAGRQVGKSTIISIYAGEFAVNNPKKEILIISATERQAYLLFVKVLQYLDDNYKRDIKMGKDRPTKSQINLKNGAIIRCLPTGMNGLGIRGYTTHLLIADEAAFINKDVWQAVIPQLTTTGGHLILLSTPFGRNDFFYESYTHDDSFKTWHINAEEIAEQRDEPQRSHMLKDQERQRRMMPHKQYLQEYIGEFVDELLQFFPDELIKECMKVRKSETIDRAREHFLGVDVARQGGDESTFEVVKMTGKRLVHCENLTSQYTYLNETTKFIIGLDKKYDFKKIYIDDGGLGVGVADYLLDDDQTKRKTVTINNRSRSIEYDPDKPRTKKLLKEDLYNNLRALMERGEIDLLDDEAVFQSLKSVQCEFDDTPGAQTRLKIFGKYTHIAEGLIRAAWSIKEKHLNLWVSAI